MERPPAPTRAMSSKRNSKVQPIEVQNILNTTGARPAKPSPVEHISSPTSPTHPTDSTGRASFQNHGRTMSTATSETGGSVATRTNRFSVSFPVHPPRGTSPTRMSQSPVREIAAPVVPIALAAPTGPTDTNYLTAIATQERRVLELKEELQRAEADLVKLKKQWAQHEASKKRNDARRVTKLQPLVTTLTSVGKEEDTDGSSAWMQQEMERRKALLSGGRSSNRTVFSGSRHTRALSLLSPARENGSNPTVTRQALPPRKESIRQPPEQPIEEIPAQRPLRPMLVARASTTPDLTTEVAETADPSINLPDNLEKALDRDLLLQTGKKMANDLRDGLWTFFEDLRQATVGDEATQHETVLPANQVRKQTSKQTLTKVGSRSSLRPSSRGSTVSGKSVETTKRPSPVRRHTRNAPQSALPDLADPGFWSEHGVAALQSTPAQALKKSPTIRGRVKSPSAQAAAVASPEPWDTWEDSPKESRSSSAASEATTLPSTLSGSGSPRRSTDKKDPIPWPALSKLGPATLRRTASHLMSEWEKSLTPSPGKEYTGQSDYLGLGAEAAATDIGR